MTQIRDDRIKRNGRILVALCAAAVVLLLNRFGDGAAVPQVKPGVATTTTASDPWLVTTEDDNAAIFAFASTAGDTAAKVRAAIKIDRLRVKDRLPAVQPGDAANPTTPTQPTPTTPIAAKPTWITFTDLNGFNGVSTINLDKAVCYWRATDADGTPTIMFSGESGLLGTAVETPELVKFLAEHTSPTSFVAKAAGK